MERKDVVAVVMIHNDIIVWTKGKSGKYAQTRVASQAIEVIEGLAPFEFRSKFGCRCHLKGEDGSSNGDGASELTAVLGDCCI
jgi:endoribonuclease Dicer